MQERRLLQREQLRMLQGQLLLLIWSQQEKKLFLVPDPGLDAQWTDQIGCAFGRS